MEYYVTSNDPDVADRWRSRLRDEGFDVAADYHPDAVVVSLGGDGSILYAARTLADPTILPVRTGDSAGNMIQLEPEGLVEAADRLESGEAGEDYGIERHPTLAAYRDEVELRGDYAAMNEIGLHHTSPVYAAVFAVRVDDGSRSWAFERIVGDGCVVATPFGSTGYYRSIAGGTFAEGIGVAFNNVHAPADTPGHLVVSTEAVVEVELLETTNASGAVLTRDNDENPYELRVGEPLEIHTAEKTVELIRFEEPSVGN